MSDDDKILIDEKEKIAVRRGDFPNEISTLATLVHGLKQLYALVKQRENDFEQAGGNKIVGFSFGSTTPEESFLNTSIACYFHWFGTSLCNYVRLSGYVRGMTIGEFTRADLTSGSGGTNVKKAIDKYVKSVDEIAEVLVWRNKVFGHFAITDPRNDNIATLDMSVISPVTLEERYCVGGLTMLRKNSSGSHTSGLPRWSLTGVFESLEPRYWPGLSFAPRNPTPGEKHSHPAIDRILKTPMMKRLVGDPDGADGTV